LNLILNSKLTKNQLFVELKNGSFLNVKWS